MDTSIKAGKPSAQVQPEAPIDVDALLRGHRLSLVANHRKLSLANERKLKGLYVDFLFKALNLTKYR